MLKDGMKIEATHVKKKQLHQYLPPELVQKKKRVRYLPVHVGTKPQSFFNVSISLYIVCLFISPLSSFAQSIAELNRSSNGGSSKRISLDSSHLDSSRDTDSGTPFNSPTSKPLKPTSDTDDRYDTPLHFECRSFFYLYVSARYMLVLQFSIAFDFFHPQMLFSDAYPIFFHHIFFLF